MAVSVEHQTLIKVTIFRGPASEEAVHVGTAYLHLSWDGAARNSLDRRQLTRDRLIQIPMSFGTYCKNGYVYWTSLRTGNPQLRGTFKGYRPDILRLICRKISSTPSSNSSTDQGKTSPIDAAPRRNRAR